MSIELIIIQVITFIAIIFILRALFYSQLNSALARLNRLHEENLVKEEELNKELEEAKVQRAKEVQKGRDEAVALIKEARLKAEKLAEELGAKAKLEAQNKFEHADEELGKIRSTALAESHEKAVGMSLKMLEAVFTEQGKEALQRELVSELLDEIKNLDKSKFTVKAKEADVVSAYPMASEERLKLGRIISDRVGSHVDIKESVDKSAIAGLVIRIGALTIDGSIRNKLKKVLPHIK